VTVCVGKYTYIQCDDCTVRAWFSASDFVYVKPLSITFMLQLDRSSSLRR